jgi:type I restriction-modification system DNA methylase subunit
MWNKIQKLADQHGYMSGVDRMSERIKASGEVFTPTKLVCEILQQLPIEEFRPGKTVLDPACGDGQFLVPVKHLKMYQFNMSEQDALKDIYGVDIMRDNVDLCKARLGGGNIVMGDTLNPNDRLEGQTDEEHQKMIDWFGTPTLESFFT